jgi:hypothetical protein
MLESGGRAQPFLTSAIIGIEWSTSLPCRFTPGDTAWLGPRAGLEIVKKRKIFTLPGIEHRLSIP